MHLSLLSAHQPRINRIRLEFKGRTAQYCGNTGDGINRIRLEFKGDQGEIL